MHKAVGRASDQEMEAAQAVVRELQSDPLTGFTFHPRSISPVGLIVLGNGSSPQLSSDLAKAVAASGIPVFLSGAGEPPELTDTIDAAASEITHARRFCLWGFGAAAVSALQYAPTDRRIAGLILVNPGARPDATREAIANLESVRGRVTIIFHGEIRAAAAFLKSAGPCLRVLQDQGRLAMHKTSSADWQGQVVLWSVAAVGNSVSNALFGLE